MLNKQDNKMPNRVRWGFFFYVNTRALTYIRVIEAIEEFKAAHNIEINSNSLRREYYELAKLHRDCIKNEV